jgi:hypothetical protein
MTVGILLYHLTLQMMVDIILCSRQVGSRRKSAAPILYAKNLEIRMMKLEARSEDRRRHFFQIFFGHVTSSLSLKTSTNMHFKSFYITYMHHCHVAGGKPTILEFTTR